MYFWPVLAILLWLFGYFMTARAMSRRGSFSEDLEKIVAPPKWLYYMCGVPSNKEYPRGTMRIVALRMQIMGIALMIFLLCFYLLRFSRIEFFVGIGLVFLVSFALPAYIAKEAIKEPIVIQKGNSVTPTKINEDLSYSIEGNWIDLYSKFGSSGGANLTIDLEELDMLIETLQGIKAFLQSEQSDEAGEKN